MMKIADLSAACRERGISPDETWVGRDYLMALRQYSLSRQKASWGMRARCHFFMPMLLFSDFKHLPDGQKEEYIFGDRWVWEQKWDGLRAFVCYYPEEGFTVFGREVGADFLPEDFTQKILWKFVADGPCEYETANIIPFSFVLDCELIFKRPSCAPLVDLSSIGAGRRLGSVDFLMGTCGDSEMHSIQALCDARFMVLDCLSVANFDLTERPFFDRRIQAAKIVNALGSRVRNFELSEFSNASLGKCVDALTFAQQNLGKGIEGLVFKNLDAKYLSKGQRSKKAAVKWRWS